MFYIQSNDCTKLAVYDYNPHGSGQLFLFMAGHYLTKCLNIKFPLYYNMITVL